MPGSPRPFHHPTLPSGGTEGNEYRGKWVSRVTVWERWVRRKETGRTGRNGLLAVQVQCSFSPDDFLALNCLKTGSDLEQSFKLLFLLTPPGGIPLPPN